MAGALVGHACFQLRASKPTTALEGLSPKMDPPPAAWSSLPRTPRATGPWRQGAELWLVALHTPRLGGYLVIPTGVQPPRRFIRVAQCASRSPRLPVFRGDRAQERGKSTGRMAA